MHVSSRAALIGAALFAIAVPGSAQTNDPNTNNPATNRMWADVALRSNIRIENIPTFYSLLEIEVQKAARPVAIDRVFGPGANLQMHFEMDAHGYQYWNDYSSRGQRAVSESLMNGLRETAVIWYTPTLNSWENWAENKYPWLDKLINGVEWTVGNTDEQSMDPLSPFSSASKRAWYERLRLNGRYQYGIRLGSSPYVYVTGLWGHNNGGPAFITNIRWYYDIGKAANRATIQFVVPLDTWRIDAALSCDPSKFDRGAENPPIVTFGFDKDIGIHWYFDSFGARMSSHFTSKDNFFLILLAKKF